MYVFINFFCFSLLNCLFIYLLLCIYFDVAASAISHRRQGRRHQGISGLFLARNPVEGQKKGKDLTEERDRVDWRKTGRDIEMEKDREGWRDRERVMEKDREGWRGRGVDGFRERED